MSVFALLAFALIALIFWAYLKFAPKGTTLRSRRTFELFVLLAEVIGCISVIYYAYATVGQGNDRGWWSVVAFMYCCMIVPCILVLSALVRMLMYKRKNSNASIEQVR